MTASYWDTRRHQTNFIIPVEYCMTRLWLFIQYICDMINRQSRLPYTRLRELYVFRLVEDVMSSSTGGVESNFIIPVSVRIT